MVALPPVHLHGGLWVAILSSTRTSEVYHKSINSGMPDGREKMRYRKRRAPTPDPGALLLRLRVFTNLVVPGYASGIKFGVLLMKLKVN